MYFPLLSPFTHSSPLLRSSPSLSSPLLSSCMSLSSPASSSLLFSSLLLLYRFHPLQHCHLLLVCPAMSPCVCACVCVCVCVCACVRVGVKERECPPSEDIN